MTDVVQPQVRKPRFKGHEPFNSVLREDWIKSIKLNPDHFEASLYRPVGEIKGDTDDKYQEETVLELDTNQDSLTYGDPELVAVVDCPDEQESFFMMADGESNLGEGVEPLMLRIGEVGVPIGSVLEWDEETASGIRTVWWYVHKAMGYGAANIGVIHICIPMRDFNKEPAAGSSVVAPEPQEQAAVTQNDEQDEGVIEL